MAGPCAFSLRRGKRYGLVGLWAIAAEVFVLATYVMDSLDGAKDDLDDAMTMVASAYFEDADGGGAGAE